MTLPESVQEIADVIGVERALYLVGKLPQAGGRPWRRVLYVPKAMPADHWLVGLLGWADAERMRRHFGGAILQPSNCNHLARAHRDAAIRRMGAGGASAQVIASVFGISDRKVRNVLREMPPEDRAEVPCNHRSKAGHDLKGVRA